MVALGPLRAKLESLSVPPAIIDELERGARPCLSLVPDRTSKARTRFGGDPLADKRFTWPKVEGAYANFVGQLDFAELPGLGLPDAGLLYLFVSFLGPAIVPVNVHGVYVEQPGRLAPRSPPGRLCDDETLIDLEPVVVTTRPGVSLPLGDRALRKRLRELEDLESYLLDELDVDFLAKKAIGRVGGWARKHQGADLHRVVQLEAMGQGMLQYADYWDTEEEFAAAVEQHPPHAGKADEVRWLLDHAQEIARGTTEWRLLLRLDSNGAMNLNINDSDPLFVFIHEADLAARRFDRLAGRVLQG